MKKTIITTVINVRRAFMVPGAGQEGYAERMN